MSDINCPYCNVELDINHDDGQGYAEDETHQQTCEHCEKTFIFKTSIVFYYDPSKADCLNETAEHDYEPTYTHPKEFTRMRCIVCDDERKPTEEEMKEILK